MALTLTSKADSVFGNMRIKVFDAAFDSSYDANGEALTAAQMGFLETLFVAVEPKDETTGSRLYTYDYANAKLLAIEPTQQTAGAGNRPGLEVAGATDLATSQHTVRILAIGR